MDEEDRDDREQAMDEDEAPHAVSAAIDRGGRATGERTELEGGARARRGAVFALALALALPAALLFAWSRPQSVPPREMPALSLSPDAIAEQLASDSAAARQAPSDAVAQRRAQLYRETLVAEHGGRDVPGRAHARRDRLQAVTRALEEQHGEAGIVGTRAADLERATEALSGALVGDEAVAALGGFTQMMHRYGLARGSRQIAPQFVVRTVFKARWNGMHGLELTAHLGPSELTAYWGWLALRADEAPLELRLSALTHYGEAGGRSVEEARGVLLFDAGRFEQAERAFEEAHARAPSFRLRNHALAAAEAALPEPPP